MKLDIESKLHILEQYLATRDKNTPHYRDTKKHYERLRTKYLKELKGEKWKLMETMS